MRKLATIRTIDNITPIPNADAIETITVGGWNVVSKKGQFKVGDRCVYIEIDSVLPENPEYEFLRKTSFIDKNGFKGFRLKTIKLRGQISQGLVIPVPEEFQTFNLGTDVSEPLGIVKYDPPVPAEVSGTFSGPYPSFIPKTDQERIQNLSSEFENWKTENDTWEVTEKLDGTSMTIYHMNGHIGVCGRNWEFKYNENHTMWKIANEIKDKLSKIGNLAFQGELIGPGIQGNHYKLNKPEYRVFNVFNIDTGHFLDPFNRLKVTEKIGLLHVPVILKQFEIGCLEISDILEYADFYSVINDSVKREGLVFKSNNYSDRQFKAISNSFLL